MTGGEKSYEILINENNTNIDNNFLTKLYEKRMEIIFNIIKRVIIEK